MEARHEPHNLTWAQFFLINSMFLQLSLFFTVTAISLWIDQLRNSEIAVLALHAPVYYALFVFTVAVRAIFPAPTPHEFA